MGRFTEHSIREIATAMASEGVAKTTTTVITKTDDGEIELVAAVDHDRLILAMYGQTVEDFSDGTGSQTVVEVGDGTTVDAFLSADGFADDSVDDVNGAGLIGENSFNNPPRGYILPANSPIVATVTPAVGDGTGGVVIACLLSA